MESSPKRTDAGCEHVGVRWEEQATGSASALISHHTLVVVVTFVWLKTIPLFLAHAKLGLFSGSSVVTWRLPVKHCCFCFAAPDGRSSPSVGSVATSGSRWR